MVGHQVPDPPPSANTRAGLSRPAVHAIIAALVTLVTWGAIAWGLQEPGVLTATEGSPAAGAIGLALAPAIIAPMMLLLYLKGVRAVRAARRGENVLARWIVSAAELAEFRRNDAARNALGRAYRNLWKPPRRDPQGGIEVIFVPDAVVVGPALYPLVNTGMFRFAGVQVLPERPLAIEFGTITTSFASEPTVKVSRSRAVLRLPVARRARDDLPRVLRHFQQVDARKLVVNPGFYLSRIRVGLIAAPVCFALAALGFWLGQQAGGDETTDIVGLTLAVSGVMFGFGGLILAAAAWTLRQGQVRRR
jgi:hypothetical protein